MAVVPGHHDAVRELRPVPRARFFFAGEQLELDVFVAGIFSEAPQVGVKGFCGVHAGEWGRVGRSVGRGAEVRRGRACGRIMGCCILFSPCTVTLYVPELPVYL